MQRRNLPVAVAGQGMSEFQRRVRRFGSLVPAIHADGTLKELGRLNLTFYLLLCIVGAGLSQLVAMSLEGEHRPTIGISGGVMALLPAFAILFPRARITLLIPPIPLPAPVFVLLYALIELSLGWSGARTGIAHFAHLGGMACGLVVLGAWYFGGELRPRPLQPPPDRDSPTDRGRPPD